MSGRECGGERESAENSFCLCRNESLGRKIDLSGVFSLAREKILFADGVFFFPPVLSRPSVENYAKASVFTYTYSMGSKENFHR